MQRADRLVVGNDGGGDGRASSGGGSGVGGVGGAGGGGGGGGSTSSSSGSGSRSGGANEQAGVTDADCGVSPALLCDASGDGWKAAARAQLGELSSSHAMWLAANSGEVQLLGTLCEAVLQRHGLEALMQLLLESDFQSNPGLFSTLVWRGNAAVAAVVSR